MSERESRLSTHAAPSPGGDVYRALIERSLFATGVIAQDGTLLYASRQLAGLFGLTAEEAIGRNAIEMLQQADRPPVREQIARHFAANNAFVLGERLRPLRADGTAIEVEIIASIAELEGQRLMIVSAANPGEQHRKSEEKYQRLLDNLPVAVWESDWSAALEMLRREGIDSIEAGLAAFYKDPRMFNRIAGSLRIAQANHRALSLAGVPDREAFGQWIASTAFPPESMSCFVAAAAPVLLGERQTAAFELKLQRTSGELLDVLLHLARPKSWNENPSMFVMAVDLTEQKRTERDLTRSEQRYRQLFMNLPIAAWETDCSEVVRSLKEAGIDSPEKLAAVGDELDRFGAVIGLARIVAVNPAALSLIGATNSPEPTQRRRRMFTQEAAALLAERLAPLFLGDQCSVTVEMPIRRMDGEMIDVLMRFARDEKWDEDQTMFAIALDITAAKRSAREQLSAKAYLDNLLDTASAMIVELDLDGRVRRLNKMGEELTGYAREELLHQSWSERMVPASRAANIDAFLRGLRDGTLRREGESPIVRRDGEERTIAWRNSAVCDVNGVPIGLLAVGVDVTERRKAEAEKVRLQSQMQEMAEEWRDTFDTVNTPIVITNNEGVVTRVNRAARDLIGKEFRQIVGQPVAEPDSGEPWRAANALLGNMRREGSVTTTEAVDVAGRTWGISVERFKAGAEDPRFIIVLWNVTDIVELQKSLRRSETMAAMGTLVGAVAHEVRNPLFGISSTLDAHALELSAPALAECTATLRSEVRRLTQLMQELLEYGRPQTPNIEPASIEDVIEEAVGNRRQAALKGGISIQTEVGGVPPLQIDRAKMRQVFENLIENAVQHSPRGGAIRISGSVVMRPDGDWFECRVEDRGSGFSRESLDRVFEPFFTQRPGGIGLGLSIVQRIVEEHCGRVNVGNRAEGGAVITVLLPIAGSR